MSQEVLPVSLEILGAQAQAAISAVPFHNWVLPGGALWLQFFRQEDGSYLLRFPGLADFSVSRGGNRVCVWPVADVSQQTVKHLFLNQIQPLALSRQGKLVLHAGAVEIDDAAAVFLGRSGRGKSTLTASFATSGFSFLTDDGLVLAANADGYLAMPSHPSIRLWEDSQQALMLQGALMAPPVQYTSKARFLAGQDVPFCDEPRRVRSMYFLGDGTHADPMIDRISSAQALIELVKHSFVLDIEEHEVISRHFEELAMLVESPMFYRLDYPRHYNDLPRVRQAVMAHVRRIGTCEV